jgi:hypothetical protein
MAIEVKEIIVRTTVDEGNKHQPFNQFNLKKLKSEILIEMKKEQHKIEKHRKER